MIEQILEERGNRYGEFAEHARITQEIKETLMSGESWDDCSDSQREALDMIAHKLGRIVNGDPDYDDSWIDIIGYSQLVLDELEDEVEIERINDEIIEEELLLDNDPETLNIDWDSLVNELEDILETLDINIKDTEPETKDDISQVEINGIQVFITGDELEKLAALKEAEDVSSAQIDEIEHEDQTFMDFGLEDELTYKEFLNNHKEQI